MCSLRVVWGLFGCIVFFAFWYFLRINVFFCIYLYFMVHFGIFWYFLVLQATTGYYRLLYVAVSY